MADPTNSSGLSCSQKTAIAGIFLVGAGFACMLFGSVYIHKHFLGEHMRYLIATIIICSIGVICGFFHVYKDIKGCATDCEWRFNTFLGYTSCYLIYFGVVFWMIFIFKYIYFTSLPIMISLWVAFGVGPFILTPIARRIYHGKWRLEKENQDPDHGLEDHPEDEDGLCRILVTNLDPNVTDEMILNHFIKIGGTITTIHGIQMQPEKSSAVITYYKWAEADFAIRVGNGNNELLGTTKIKCSWANPLTLCQHFALSDDSAYMGHI